MMSVSSVVFHFFFEELFVSGVIVFFVPSIVVPSRGSRLTFLYVFDEGCYHAINNIGKEDLVDNEPDGEDDNRRDMREDEAEKEGRLELSIEDKALQKYKSTFGMEEDIVSLDKSEKYCPKKEEKTEREEQCLEYFPELRPRKGYRNTSIERHKNHEDEDEIDGRTDENLRKRLTHDTESLGSLKLRREYGGKKYENPHPEYGSKKEIVDNRKSQGNNDPHCHEHTEKNIHIERCDRECESDLSDNSVELGHV